MTVVLFLCTIIAFLTADHFVQRARARKVVETVRDRVGTMVGSLKQIPSGIELAFNHLWTKREEGTVVTVGFDEFIARFFGKLDRIALPAVGESAGKIFLAEGERMIPLLCPVNGRVVAVNQQVLNDPGLAYSDPYGGGWLFRVEVRNPQPARATVSVAPADWLREQVAAAREFFLRHSGAQNYALMQDGGAIVDGVLKMYDNAVWAEFSEMFLAMPSVPSTTPDAPRA